MQSQARGNVRDASEGKPMPRYQCCFLDESAEIVRIEVLDSCDDRDACREAMTLMARIGRFCGFELWDHGRKVDVYRPIKIGAAP